MRIELDYGKHGLMVDIENPDVIYPEAQKALPDPHAAIIEKLYAPDFGAGLRELVRGKTTVAVAHTDITRATPNDIIIPLLISALISEGIKRENIVLVNMTGSHRPQTQDELDAMLTPEIARNFRCVQHDSFDYSTMSKAGDFSDGSALYVNTEFLNADLKICTGFIEPHFFAGFSGGPKAVFPGLADIESIMRNHNAARIASEKATWGITEGNPVWENIREGARLVNPDFLLNVALNTENRISGVFAGEWEKTHKKGCGFVKAHAMREVDKPYDIVITTNSGYPLDMNLYQCVKGMSAAAGIVKDGGTIIVAGECSDGLPEGSHYQKILSSETTPEAVFARIVNSEKTIPEQWQVQIQARIQKRAKVFLYSSLPNVKVREAMLSPCSDISELARSLKGRVAVLPKGPQTIPYLKEAL